MEIESIQLISLMQSQRQYLIKLLFPFFILGYFTWSCSNESLGPVYGAEGRVIINGEWPDSIQAVTVIVLTDLDVEHIAEYFVDYGEILENGGDTLHYFIQLEEGSYNLVPVAILDDPAFIITNLDSILNAGDIPIDTFEDDNIAGILRQSTAFRTEKKVTLIPDMVINF